ncbi:hypothetical protein DSM112329_01122 [Paraconexibacter sp. AEG42_29]|uniref:Cupin type-2 domain-containing protein n=1 Tax=Paraconexibacter sp. AEG42_29 TaxID=2997339 RepID=A0AAU7ARG0_9ACTN
MHDWGPGVGMQWETTRSAAETNGALLEGTMWFAPRMAGPPVHVHPAAEETFTVLEGGVEVLLDGTWSPVAVGETSVVPRGAPHSVRNLSDTPAKLVNTHSPAQQMEGFFIDGASLAGAGKITSLPPKNPKSAIYAAMLFTKYPDEIVAVGPKRPLFRALTLIGRTLGWKA